MKALLLVSLILIGYLTTTYSQNFNYNSLEINQSQSFRNSLKNEFFSTVEYVPNAKQLNDSLNPNSNKKVDKDWSISFK